MKKRCFLYISFILIFLNLLSISSYGSTIKLSSIPALQSAINNAVAGDILVLADGTYLNNVLNIGKSNITIKAASSGGVFLNGTNDINITGNYVTFSGFQFTVGDIGLSYLIEVSGNNNSLTHLNFNGYYAKKYIEIKGGTQFNEISYCNIEKKPLKAELGCTIQISTSPTILGYHKIRYCSFQNFEGIGGDNGNEPVRIGLGVEALNASRTVVEYCYFYNTGLGDSESVSVKSQENTIRFCTFTNQQNAMLVFRNGDNNAAYGNFFIDAGGIRVKEANNIFCYNNYFENAGTGNSADAITYDFVSPNLKNINFIHNTFVSCGNIDLGGKGATNNTWANNIFKKSIGNIFTNANTGTTWVGNIYLGSLGISIASGMTNIDPKLEKNRDGYQGISSGSPAIDASSSNYPAIIHLNNIDDDPNILMDISGQVRPAILTLKDVGCDEFTTGNITNRPLKLTDVGPLYLNKPVVLGIVQNTEQNSMAIVFPNPATNTLQLKLEIPVEAVQGFDIYSLNGILLKTVSNFENQEFNHVDVSDLSDGVYLVNIKTLKFTKTIKIVIQH